MGMDFPAPKRLLSLQPEVADWLLAGPIVPTMSEVYRGLLQNSMIRWRSELRQASRQGQRQLKHMSISRRDD